VNYILIIAQYIPTYCKGRYLIEKFMSNSKNPIVWYRNMYVIAKAELQPYSDRRVAHSRRQVIIKVACDDAHLLRMATEYLIPIITD